jgi:hypothetical protein
VRDLAAQAGLVMRNVALTEELMGTIKELRASRQHLVTAQDEGRRRIERNLHDGAQQQIVALTVRLRLLGQLVERDAEKAKSMAADLQADANDALEQLRDLARGIYPPLLADQGLVAALEAQARKASVPTEVRSDGIGRPQDTEAAVYFCVLEALNNVAKYSRGDRSAGHPGPDQRRAHLRGHGRWNGLRCGRDELRDGAPGDGRPLGRDRWCPPRRLTARRRHDGRRKDPGARHPSAYRPGRMNGASSSSIGSRSWSSRSKVRAIFL